MDSIKSWLDPKIPIIYFIVSFIVLCAVILVGIPILKRQGARKFVFLSFCCEYYFLVLCSTVIRRTATETHLTKFMPFWNYMDIWNQKDHPNDLIEVILNIVMFIPIGLLLGCGIRKMKWWYITIVGCCLSIIIEGLQFITSRGLCETDDVIHNTLGTMIGYALFVLLRKFIKYASVTR